MNYNFELTSPAFISCCLSHLCTHALAQGHLVRVVIPLISRPHNARSALWQPQVAYCEKEAFSENQLLNVCQRTRPSPGERQVQEQVGAGSVSLKSSLGTFKGDKPALVGSVRETRLISIPGGHQSMGLDLPQLRKSPLIPCWHGGTSKVSVNFIRPNLTANRLGAKEENGTRSTSWSATCGYPLHFCRWRWKLNEAETWAKVI